MAVSKAQQKAVHKYISSHYDRFGITMPAGSLDRYKALAASKGESLNAMINRLLEEELQASEPLPVPSPDPGDPIF